MIGARIDVVGRLVRDPELKATQSSTIIARGSIAYNLYEGEKKGKTSHFLDFFAFGKMAENICKNLSKGKQVRFSGSLVHQRWEHEGKKFSKHEMKIQDMEFVGKKEDGGGHNVPPDSFYDDAAPPPSSGQSSTVLPADQEGPGMGVIVDDDPFGTDNPLDDMSEKDIPF